jgi:hypothetical protein
MWKGRVMMMMTSFAVPQTRIFTGAASLVEVDGFGDASSPCEFAAEPFVSF